jgi:hypothetical protein
MSRSVWQLRTLAIVLAVGWMTAAAQAQLGPGFSYQGQLRQGGSPVTEMCHFEFSLWDDEFAGEQVGLTQYVLDVDVQRGLFTVLLNEGGEFGLTPFDGQPRWLEITVTVPPDDPVTLSPRQPVTPTPHTFYAEAAPWSGLTGVPDDFADGVDNDTTYEFGEGLLWDGVILSLEPDYMLPQACADGQVPKWNSVSDLWECADDQTGTGAFWSLAGNSGTLPGTNFLGTTDNVSLELRVNNATALRIEPTLDAPNLIGGYDGNYITPGAHRATIAGGGGYSGGANRVTDCAGTVSGGIDNQAGDAAGTTDDRQYGTVGGGRANTASGSYSTVGGGWSNTASGIYTTVGGGWSNTADNFAATVGGGNSNTASGDYAAIAGGHGNIASGIRSMIPGGMYNTAGGNYSLAAGRRAKVRDPNDVGDADGDEGTFVWADSTDADFISTGSNQFLIRASGGVGIGTDAPLEALDVVGNIQATGTLKSGSSITIDGTAGSENIASTAALELHVSSDRALRVEPSTTAPNLIGGDAANYVTPGASAATIAGGGWSGFANRVTDWYGTVSGGMDNQAGDADGLTDNKQHATVGGGQSNTASGGSSTVGGGRLNVASGGWSTVGGGYSNDAGGDDSTVAGGSDNTASGSRSTIPGGYMNTAGGNYSFAAGRRAKVRDPNASGDGDGDEGTFVWADSTDADFTSTAPNQFLIRADGGVGIGTTEPTSPLHVVDALPSNDRPAIYGKHAVTDYWGVGVRGIGGYWGVDGGVYPTGSDTYTGVYGHVAGGSGTNYGVYGYADGDDVGFDEHMYAGYFLTDGDRDSAAVLGENNSAYDTEGRLAYVGSASEFPLAAGVYGADTTSGYGYAGYFSGDVQITGDLNVSGPNKTFKIDHPLDPANKYLYHACVESDERLNVYNGNVVLDGRGEAVVELPDWFEALNRDFRYQLTCIGGFAPVYIAEEISGNRFKIAGGEPGMKVSWQVTGIRNDPCAAASPFEVEVDKPEPERGTYLAPEAWGQPEQVGLHYEDRQRRRSPFPDKEAFTETEH